MHNSIIIAGHGKLATSIQKSIQSDLQNYESDTWENIRQHKQPPKVIIHVGSGRQLPNIMTYCSSTKVPLIQASTGINPEHKNHDFTFIDAPNLSLLILKFMHMLRKNAELFTDFNITITESHQSSKQSVPGTAYEIADLLGLPSEAIKSIRQPDIQKSELNIPEEHLTLHAYHDIQIEEKGSQLNFKTLVQGHESYVKGLSKIIQCLDQLEKRYYHILDLIEMKYI